MRVPCLWPLGQMLKRRGWQVRYFGYRSTVESIEQVAVRLSDLLRQERISAVVGHSLGGVLSLAAVSRVTGLQGRVVTLGSPHRGSAVGRQLEKVPALGRIFRANNAAWRAQEQVFAPAGWQVGTIIGSVKLGAGTFLLSSKTAHDGVVLEEETYLDSDQARITLSTSHSGLLLSASVAAATDRFLRTGAF